MKDNMNKPPKDTLFFKWIPKFGSAGSLGPGYPVHYFSGESTKFTKFFVRLGIPMIVLIDFDRYVRARFFTQKLNKN